MFYAVYFSFVAIEVAYFPLHFKRLSFDYFQIALLTAISNVATVFSPFVALHLSHFKFSPRNLVLLTSGAGFFMFLPLLSISNFLPVALFWFLSLFFLRVPLIFVESVAIKDSFSKQLNYGKTRLWGSFGFIVATLCGGKCIDLFGEEVIGVLGTVFLFGLFLTTLIVRNDLSATPGKHEHGDRGLRTLFFLPERSAFVPLLVSAALAWAAMAVLYVYFSLYLQALGWSGKLTAIAWSVGVLAEVLTLLYFDTIEKYLSLRTIFRLSLIISVVRWTVLAATDSVALILLSQTLHAFSFGTTQLASMKLIYRLLPEDYRGRGQGILLALGPGTGLIIGRMLAGVGTKVFSPLPLNVLFLGAAVLSLLAYRVSRKIPEVERVQSVG